MKGKRLLATPTQEQGPQRSTKGREKGYSSSYS